MMARVLVLAVVSIHLAPAAFAQTAQTNLCLSQAHSNALVCLLSSTVGTAVDSAISGSGSNFSSSTDLGSSIFAVQLESALPAPSPAAGFVYRFDPTTGVPVRVSESLGPLMSERPETLGKGSIAVGFSFQRFTFTQLDGIDFHNYRVDTTLEDGSKLDGTYNSSLSLNQYTFFGGYGLTDRIDVSVEVPFRSVRYGLSYSGTLSSSTGERLAVVNPSGTATASGLGDVILQLKDNLLRTERGSLAVGVAVRAPTGDQYGALGAGAYGIKPFVSASYRFGRVTPHLGLAFEAGGKSYIAGSLIDGIKDHLPADASYSAGFEVAAHRRLTLALDILGQEVVNTDRITTYASTNTVDGVPKVTLSTVNGSVGFKLNLFRSLVAASGVLFRLNDEGLRSKAVPMFSLSYAY